MEGERELEGGKVWFRDVAEVVEACGGREYDGGMMPSATIEFHVDDIIPISASGFKMAKSKEGIAHTRRHKMRFE